MKKPLDIANKWRDENGYIGKGGVIVILNGEVNSWVNELRNPEHWVPGCIAVDERGNEWRTVGGTEQAGADRWEPIKIVA
ncbi:MAG: hypothetical protein C4586_08710 [Anaerolineaceae bacterium]|nr:MAG: hypothetical protein C4586_08710 [Anaerolineaceae bacterium]